MAIAEPVLLKFRAALDDEAARKYRVSVHACVLMANHVHLSMTPTSAAGITGVMQTLGRCYVRHINLARDE